MRYMYCTKYVFPFNLPRLPPGLLLPRPLLKSKHERSCFARQLGREAFKHGKTDPIASGHLYLVDARRVLQHEVLVPLDEPQVGRGTSAPGPAMRGSWRMQLMAGQVHDSRWHARGDRPTGDYAARICDDPRWVFGRGIQW
jgi:hypothetical protein